MAWPYFHVTHEIPPDWVVCLARVYPEPWELQFEGYDVVVQVLSELRSSQARVVRYATGDPYFCYACSPGQEGRAFTTCEHIEMVYALKDKTVFAPPDWGWEAWESRYRNE